jgi:hypothetical protein
MAVDQQLQVFAVLLTVLWSDRHLTDARTDCKQNLTSGEAASSRHSTGLPVQSHPPQELLDHRHAHVTVKEPFDHEMLQNALTGGRQQTCCVKMIIAKFVEVTSMPRFR